MKKHTVAKLEQKEVTYQESKNPLIGGAGPSNGVLRGGGGGGGGGSITYLQVTTVASTVLPFNKYVKVE